MSAPRPAVSPPGLATLLPGTLDCVHCGLCLSACPTYLQTGRETSSPRGRVYLMRGLVEGRIPLDGVLAEEAHLCLGCRACETACPSGVPYGALLEQTRAAVERAGLRPGWARRIERFALRQVVPRRRVLSLVMTLLAAVQSLRLDRLALPLLPRRLREAHALLPSVPPASQRRRLPAFTAAEGGRRGRVVLFEGCIMPELFGAVNRATLRVLAQQGFDVLVPQAQGCCGALQAHSGDLEFAHALATVNLSALDPGEVDAILTNSAGCGAALREMDQWLGGVASRVAHQVRDVCEFLDGVGLRGSLEPIAQRVAYDDPCHLVHAQGVSDAPRELLRAIPALELVEHDEPGSCCGAAGTYNLTQPEMSQAVLARKLDTLEPLAPDVIATGNPGCLMQLRAGAASRGMQASVLHPIELLARALPRQEGGVP